MSASAGRERFDAAIIGAGPAGAGLASAMAGAGANVLLVHREVREPRRFETVPPQALELLEGLGLGRVSAPFTTWALNGSEVSWQSAEPEWQSSIARPLGGSRVVERPLLDTALRRAAHDRGAFLVEALSTPRVRRAHDESFVIEIERARQDAACEALTLAARHVVDATGVRASVLRQLGGSRRVCDRQVSIRLEFEARNPTDSYPRIARLEACRSGWWYSLPGPGGVVQVQLFTHAAELPRPLTLTRLLARHGAESRLVLPRLAAVGFAMKPDFGAAPSESGLSSPSYPAIAAVGDAAMSFDPLASQGLLSGWTAAHQLASLLLEPGGERLLPDYWNAIGRVFGGYRDTRASHVRAAAHRFPTRFWHMLEWAGTGPPSVSRTPSVK